MVRFHPSPLLRNLLRLDGASCFAAGALMAFGGGYLAGFFNLPEMFLRAAGVFLLAFGLAVLAGAQPAAIFRAVVLAIIACNTAWALESIVLLAGGWLAPNAFGAAFVLIQGAWVAVLALAQALLLKRDFAGGAVRFG